MPDIQLNKPLFKEDRGARSGGSGAPAGPIERPAKPMIIARIGAIALDVLALHAIMLAVVKSAPDGVVRMGAAGPWIGLAVGFLYFGIGASKLTNGRTLGKFVLRMHTTSAGGEALSFSRALTRSALLLWPLAVYLLLSRIAETADSGEELNILPALDLVGLALGVAWYGGNVLHATADAFGRTLYDVLTGSILTTLDSKPDVVEGYLEQVRSAPPNRKPVTFLAASFFGLCVLAGIKMWQEDKALKDLSAEKRTELQNALKSMRVPDFMRPVQVDSREDPSLAPKSENESTSNPVLWLRYRRRGGIDETALKSSDWAMNSADRFIEMNRQAYLKARAENKVEPMNGDITFRVSFAEFGDLLFARYANDIVTITRKVKLTGDEPTSGTKAGPRPDILTTVTAVSTSIPTTHTLVEEKPTTSARSVK